MIKHAPNRHATWLELFYDLIFVVAIAKATHVLQHTHHGHIEPVYYLKYMLIMIPIWWAWVGAAMFSSRFDCNSLSHRIMSLTQMFFIIILAAHINTDFDSYYQGFLFSYAAIRILTITMYIHAGIQKAENRNISTYLAIIFSIGVTISLSSFLFDGVIRYILMYLGITFDIFAPLFAKKRLKKVPVDAHHLPERFGLLTIILFGESVLSLVSSFNTLTWDYLPLAMAISGFVLICGLWWIYFDNIEYRITGQNLGHGQAIIYSHLFIYIGLGGIASMVKFAVIPELLLSEYRVLCIFSMFTFLLAFQYQHILYHLKKTRKKLLQYSLLFNTLLLFLIIFAPSISLIMVGISILIGIYVSSLSTIKSEGY